MLEVSENRMKDTEIWPLCYDTLYEVSWGPPRDQFTRLAWKGDLSQIQPLIEAGSINLNSLDDAGWTPLAYAAVYKWKEIVDALLKHGAIPSLQTRNGHTAEELVRQGLRVPIPTPERSSMLSQLFLKHHRRLQLSVQQTHQASLSRKIGVSKAALRENYAKSRPLHIDFMRKWKRRLGPPQSGTLFITRRQGSTFWNHSKQPIGIGFTYQPTTYALLLVFNAVRLTSLEIMGRCRDYYCS